MVDRRLNGYGVKTRRCQPLIQTVDTTSNTINPRAPHLSPDHIKAAVERLVRSTSGTATGTQTGTDSQAG